MAEFYSFTALGENFLNGAYRLQAGAGRAAIYEAALHAAGRKWRDELRERIYESGPGWDDLTLETSQRRVRAGLHADPALMATLQMAEAIQYEIRGMNVEIGVDDHAYAPQNKYGTSMPMSELFIYHEVGTTKMPPRPVFTHSKMDSVEVAIVVQFSKEVIRSGIMEGPAAAARKRLRASLGM